MCVCVCVCTRQRSCDAQEPEARAYNRELNEMDSEEFDFRGREGVNDRRSWLLS